MIGNTNAYTLLTHTRELIWNDFTNPDSYMQYALIIIIIMLIESLNANVQEQ